VGEVDDDVALPDDRLEPRGDRDPFFAQAQGLAHVLTDEGMSRLLDGGRDLDAVRDVDDGRNPAAHLPSGSHDNCLYHSAPSFLAF